MKKPQLDRQSAVSEAEVKGQTALTLNNSIESYTCGPLEMTGKKNSLSSSVVKGFAVGTALCFLLVTICQGAAALEENSEAVPATTSQSLMTLPEPLNSRSSSSPHVNINFTVGGSSFGLNTSNAQESRTTLGLTGGLTADMSEFNSRSLETGIVFFQTGGRVKTPAGSGKESNYKEYTNRYLGIPLYGRFYFSDTGRGLYAKAGVLTAVRINNDSNRELRSLDILGQGGLGAKIPLQPDTDFLIEGLAARGILDQLKSDGNAYQVGYTVFTGLSISL